MLNTRHALSFDVLLRIGEDLYRRGITTKQLNAAIKSETTMGEIERAIRRGETAVEEFKQLPVGIRTRLRHNNILSVDQLTLLTREELEKLRGIGPVASRRIEQALMSVGLSLYTLRGD